MGTCDWVEGFISVCFYERQKMNKGERDWKKHRRGRWRAVSNYQTCHSVMCVFVPVHGCSSQQLASLKSVIEMTNRAAFIGFPQWLKLAFPLLLPIHGFLCPEIEFGFWHSPGVISCWEWDCFLSLWWQSHEQGLCTDLETKVIRMGSKCLGFMRRDI